MMMGRMASQRRPVGALGALESDVMAVLWTSPEALAVRAVLARLNERRDSPLAYTTVMTVLARLAEKGLATRTPAGRGFAYGAAVDDEAAAAVHGVVRDYGQAAVAHFVDHARTDPKLLRQLRQLLEDPT